MKPHRPHLKLIASVMPIALAACANSQPITLRYYPPQELSELVIGQTIRIGGGIGSDKAVLVYFAPDGHGWLDRQARPGESPTPATMSMLVNWHLAPESEICAWASPLIGEMPSFVPPHPLCVRFLRPDSQHLGITASIGWNGWQSEQPATFYPYNAFSGAVAEQYENQVRVLYGGQMPDWSSL